MLRIAPELAASHVVSVPEQLASRECRQVRKHTLVVSGAVKDSPLTWRILIWVGRHYDRYIFSKVGRACCVPNPLNSAPASAAIALSNCCIKWNGC